MYVKKHIIKIGKYRIHRKKDIWMIICFHEKSVVLKKSAMLLVDQPGMLITIDKAA